MSKLPEWKLMIKSGDFNAGFLTMRLKVFGGWMVCHMSWEDTYKSESSIFVPDPNHEWSLE